MTSPKWNTLLSSQYPQTSVLKPVKQEEITTLEKALILFLISYKCPLLDKPVLLCPISTTASSTHSIF